MNKEGGIGLPVSLLTGDDKSLKMGVDYKRVMTALFSEQGFQAFLHMSRNTGEVPDGVNLDEIDGHFFRQLGRSHGLSPSASRRRLTDHWGNSLDQAYGLVDYAIGTAIPKEFGNSGQDTELYQRSPRPSKILRTLAYHPRGRFQRETRRQFALALIVGDFMAFNGTAQLKDRNEEIGDLFSSKVFISQGSQFDFSTYGYFDSSTNEFRGASQSLRPPDAYTDVKKIERVARYIDEVGLVHYHPRIKDPNRAALKSVVKSVNDGGNLETIGSVPDKFGSKITVLEGGEAEVDIVMKKSIEVLKEAYPGVKIESKDRVGNGRGQSPLMDILVPMRRTLFTFPDLPEGASYELMVRTLSSEMNSEYMNGVVDPRTLRRTGPGHRHYELDNLAGEAFDVLFPKDIQEINKENALATQSANIADQLRDSSDDPTVHYGEIRREGYFSAGNYLATEGPDGTGGFYQIVQVASGLYRLRRPGGSEFYTSESRVKDHGLVGSERILGSIRDLMMAR